MNIRRAALEDFTDLYGLALNTPELKVADDAFMQPGEFQACITLKSGIFLVAEVGGEIAGFAFANLNDIEVPQLQFGCLVYLVAAPAYRGKGVAQALLKAVEEKASEQGLDYLYTWARMDDDRFIEGALRKGWVKGIPHLWMHKPLQDKTLRDA